MNHITLGIGTLLLAPLIFLIFRYMTRYILSFLSEKIKINLSVNGSTNHSREIKIERNENLIKELDEVLARAKKQVRSVD